MIIHKFIHRMWIITKKRTPWGRDQAHVEALRALDKGGRTWFVHVPVVVLQHFSPRRTCGPHVREGRIAPRTAGWRCWLRIYSRGSSEDFGVPVEEFDEAHLSAQSSQESQDARLPPAHEFGGRTQNYRRAPAPGTQAPGSLSVAAKQTHAPD